MDFFNLDVYSIIEYFCFGTEDSKPPSTFKFTSVYENSLLTLCAFIILFMNLLYIQYYLSLHSPTYLRWALMHAVHLEHFSYAFRTIKGLGTDRLSVFQIGSTNVQLEETQIMFKSVPLNMESTKTLLVHNSGPNHTYYKVPLMHTQKHGCTQILYSDPDFVLYSQVLDACPMPGMVVSPSEGVVPCGGHAALSIHLNPNSVIKFDTRIAVRMRKKGNTETPSLRLF